jgi:hypothetical protein
MKKSCVFVFFISYVLAGCGQQQHSEEKITNNKLFIKASVIDSVSVEEYDFLYSDRDEILRMNGPIRHCGIYDFDGTDAMLKGTDITKSSLFREITFNKTGKVLSSKSYKDSKHSYDYFWDEKQNLVFRISSSDILKPDTSYTRYEYDEYGNLLSKYEYKIGNKNERECLNYREYSYFPKDNGILIVYIKELKNNQFASEMECTFKDLKLTSLKASSLNASRIPSAKKYTYRTVNNKEYLYSEIEDFNGRGAKFKIYDRDNFGRLTASIDSLYDKEKKKYSSTRIVNEYKENTKHEMVYTNYSDSLFVFEHVDIKQTSGLQEETVYSYDEHDNKKTEASGPPLQPRHVKSYKYSYDDYNNWINSTYYFSFDGERHYKSISDENLVSQNIRILTYFKSNEMDKPQDIPAPDIAAEKAKLKMLEENKYFKKMKFKNN